MLSPRTNEKSLLFLYIFLLDPSKTKWKTFALTMALLCTKFLYDNEQKYFNSQYDCLLFFLTLQWISKCEFPWHLKEYQKIIFIYFLLQKNRKKKLKFYKLVGKFDFSPNAHTSQDFEEWNFFFIFFVLTENFPIEVFAFMFMFSLASEDTKYLIWEQKISAKVSFSKTLLITRNVRKGSCALIFHIHNIKKYVCLFVVYH